MEIRKILAYRSDFWITFIGQTIIQISIARALWQSIFASEGVEVMQGFTLPMMTLYYLIIPIGTKILTGENIGFLSREIYDGTFNRYLIYPLSFFQYKSLTYMTYSAFYGLQLILIYCGHSFFQYGSISLLAIANLTLGIGLFMVAAFAYCMLAMIIELLSLWADNIWSLMVLCRFVIFFLGGSHVPLNFFPTCAQEALKYTPFPYFISLPARTIMGISTYQEILSGFFFLIVW